MMADKASKKWNELLAFGIITLLDHRWMGMETISIKFITKFKQSINFYEEENRN